MGKMKARLVSILLGLVLAITIGSTPVVASDEGVALAAEWTGSWWDDMQDFGDIIDAYTGWNNYFTSHDPYATWWQEESSSGIDNQKADYTELSLILSHSADLGGGLIGVGFGTGKSATSPTPVRLGYESADDFGYNLWWFIIECEVLKDTSYPSWKDVMTGTHILLGFKTDAVISSTDLCELANRLTGTGGYSKHKIWTAFAYTYTGDDGTHDDNIVRILYETTDALSNDYIDSFNRWITVDSTKYSMTYGG